MHGPTMIVVLLAWVCCVTALSQAPPQSVTLPNWDSSNGPQPNIKTGYINVNATFGRHLFYWLIEATEVDPSTAPLVLWQQGGPGGSGEFGLFYEQGPLFLKGDVSNVRVSLRKTGAWTKWVNMIFIDQPAGVTFSYSTSASDYALNSDTRSARDNFVFMQEFFKINPSYQGRKWWITGESYGGVYCPMLAHHISLSSMTHSFEGIMIGNPVFRCDRDEIGSSFQIMNLLYWNGLVSYEDMKAFWDNDCTNSNARGGYQSHVCLSLLAKVNNPTYLGKDFDGDDQFMDPCTANGTLAFAASQPPCRSNYNALIEAYVGQSSVISAIHAVTPKPRPNWSYDMNVKSMLPYYAPLIAQKKKILVYSGDLDIQTVPFAYTQPCLAVLPNRGSRKVKWQPWLVNGHTAGHWEQFEAYTYMTVRGGGHETPAFQPLLTDAMFYRFLTNGTLSNAKTAPLQRAQRPVDFSNPLFGLKPPSHLYRELLRKQKQ